MAVAQVPDRANGGDNPVYRLSTSGDNFHVVNYVEGFSPSKGCELSCTTGDTRTMNMIAKLDFGTELPAWVPEAVRRYLCHTLMGVSLRDMARVEGCHASTIMRQVRRFENRRDDPLVDDALEVLARCMTRPDHGEGNCLMSPQTSASENPDPETTATLSNDELEREARRVLRRLCEPGAQLVVAVDMDKAAVLRSHNDEAPTRTAVVSRAHAQAFALKDWISCKRSGRVTSYRVTQSGRMALNKMLAEDENRKRQSHGFEDVATPFVSQSEERAALDRGERARFSSVESPLSMLGRRRDKTGKPFLEAPLVQAGERFREDFELSQLGRRLAQRWDQFQMTEDRLAFMAQDELDGGCKLARERVMSAIDDLGPGLSDIIIRCCCFLEGLETAEKRMGWSARSGKVVLRIALQRLSRHYIEKHGVRSALIG